MIVEFVDELRVEGCAVESICRVLCDTNIPMRTEENKICEAVTRAGRPVDIEVEPIYGNGNGNPPTAIRMRATGTDLDAGIDETIPNIP